MTHASELPPRLDAAGLQQLLEKHEPMFWWLARRVCRGGTPDQLEDVAAEVRRLALEFARRFDPTRGVTFMGYALRLLTIYARRYWLAERLRGVHAPANHPALSAIPAPLDLGRVPSCDHPADPAGEDGRRSPEVEARDRAAVWDAVRAVLTPRQFSVVAARFRDGLTIREINRRAGMSHGWANQVLRSAFRRIRNLRPDIRECLS